MREKELDDKYNVPFLLLPLFRKVIFHQVFDKERKKDVLGPFLFFLQFLDQMMDTFAEKEYLLSCVFAYPETNVFCEGSL